MADLIDRLKTRIAPDTADDALLEEMIESAIALYVSLKYPYGGNPVDIDDNPILGVLAKDWVLRCAIEFYSRMGSEGQISHSENSIARAYEAGTISLSLRKEIIPACGVASS